MVLPQPGPTRLRDYPAFSRFVTRVIDWPVLGFDSPKHTVRVPNTRPGTGIVKYLFAAGREIGLEADLDN